MARGDEGDAADPGGAGYFTDADDLEAPGGAGAGLAAVLASLLRADIAGNDRGAVERSFSAARDREAFRFAWNDAMRDAGLTSWIDASEERRARASAIALALAPPDPSVEHNAAPARLCRGFDAWERYPYAVIVVPGYTPLDTTTASPGVHPVARRRLEQAVSDFAQGKAPFILVSGANVYPRGTPYYEALEMKAELSRMGMAEDRVFVDARARHSTTNLRNAGRIMLAHGMKGGLIATVGGGVLGSDVFGQDFYFAHPILSTFFGRCARELGYWVGLLGDAGAGRVAFVPSASVQQVNYRDVLDP